MLQQRKEAHVYLKVEEAKAEVTENFPFAFGSVLRRMDLRPGQVPRASTSSRGVCHYNLDWFYELKTEEVVGVLLHEAFHLIFQHFTVCPPGYQARRANIAQDIPINDLLSEMGVCLPKDCVFSHTFHFPKGKSWVWYYEQLEQEDLDIPDFPGCGPCCGYDPDSSTEDWSLSPEETENLCHALKQYSHHTDLQKWIERVHRKSYLNWKKLLARRLGTLSYTGQATHLTFAPPSRRGLVLGAVRPQVVGKQWKAGLIIDTSGSMVQDHLLLSLVDAIADLMNNCGIRTLIVAEADTEIQRCAEMTSRQLRQKKEFMGGGGTNFGVPIQQLRKKYPDLNFLMYATDGIAEAPDKQDLVGLDMNWLLYQDQVAVKLPGNTVVAKFL